MQENARGGQKVDLSDVTVGVDETEPE